MKDKTITLGTSEAIVILINALCSRIFINFPRPFTESAGNAAWIQIIYVCIVVIIIFSIIQKLFSNFEGLDIIDVGEYALGTLGRYILGIPIILILLFIGSVILREYSENMKIISLPTSPISFVMLFFIIGMISGAFTGIEAITRFHILVVPIITVAYLVILFGVTKYIDITNFFPILGNGPKAIFGDGLIKISLFSPLLYLLLIIPYLKTHKNFKMAGYMTLLFSSTLFILGTIAYIGIFPYNTSVELFLPTFELARLVDYGRFFQRLESIFMLSWATSGLMYLSVILFFIVNTFKKVFKLDYYKPLILPFSVLIFSLSIFPPNLMTSIILETKYYTMISWIITMLLPLLFLILANIRKKYFKGAKK